VLVTAGVAGGARWQNGSGEARRRCTGGAGRGLLRLGEKPALLMGAAASSCVLADVEAGVLPHTATGARDRGGAADRPVGKGRARPSTTPEAPRRGNGFRGPRRTQHLGKELPTLGTGAGESRRRGRGGAARARARRRGAASHARKQFTVPLFRHQNLQKLE
jgi:hypothetical protein